MYSIIIGHKSWWSNGHSKRLGKKTVGSWGPVATSIRLVHDKYILNFSASQRGK